MIPVGADSHTYEASPREIVRLARSDAFVYMGAHAERFIDEGGWLAAVDEAKTPTLRYAEHMELIFVNRIIDHGDHTHDYSGGDPHVWLDPARVHEMADLTAAFLARIDPGGKATYEANARRYREQLVTLERELDEGIARIPPERRKLVVFHDAYTYFAKRYGFEIVDYVIKSSGAEPSAAEIAGMHRTIRQHRVPAVFKEPQFNAAILDRVAAETGVKVGTLLTDNFTPEVTTYLNLMRFNLKSLVTLLGS